MLVGIADGPCPKDDFDDVVHHISIDDEPEAETEERVYGLLRVVGSDISVTDGRDCVDTPVQGIEVSDVPAVVHNWGVSSGRIQPTD